MVGLSDFLMKYIIIGAFPPLVLAFPPEKHTPGEAGTGKSCLLHHFIHNSCMCDVLSAPAFFDEAQSNTNPNIPSASSSQVAQSGLERKELNSR